MPPIIRPRVDADLPAVCTVITNVYNHSGYPIQGVATAHTFLTFPPPDQAWVAEANRQILGHASVTKLPQVHHLCLPDHPDTTAELGKLFISPDAHGKGLGRKLVDASVEWADSVGLKLTLFALEKDKAAIMLYERLGWRKTREFMYKYGDGQQMRSFVYVWDGKQDT